MVEVIYICSSGSRPPSLPPKPKKRRIGRSQMVGQPKLFGGSLEEYVEVSVNVLYGLRGSNYFQE